MKKQFALLLLFIWLLFPSTVFAARNIVISGDKPFLLPDEELIVSASISGFVTGEKIYLKGAFFKENASNYFGLTKFNESWIKNSVTALSQKEVTIGSWDSQIYVKPDYSDTGFSGKGDYKLKLGFYYLTTGGNASSINWSSNDLSVSLIAPSKAPEEQSESQSLSSNSKSTSSSSKTPTPTKINNPTPSSVSKKVASFAKISLRPKTASEFAKIKPITRHEKIKKKIEVLGAKDTKFPSFLFLGGIFLLLAALFLVVRSELKKRKII